MNLAAIANAILDETSSTATLHQALDSFALQCSGVTGIVPDRSFDAWADDALLATGVAINPQAAAHCVCDYQRSVVFIRALHAAIGLALLRFPNSRLQILYAGCGPFASLLLPLLKRFSADQLEVSLLDVHPRSLHAVSELLVHFELDHYHVQLVQADASNYQHPVPLHLIIAETMQKSLEQEPQFAVTAKLAPQLCGGGIFIPEKISVDLYLAQRDSEAQLATRAELPDLAMLLATGKRLHLANVLTLKPAQAAAQHASARPTEDTAEKQLPAVTVAIPALARLDNFEALLCTRLQVFGNYQLQDYEAEITLPLRCQEMLPLQAGARYEICYQLGSYPRFAIRPLTAQTALRC